MSTRVPPEEKRDHGESRTRQRATNETEPLAALGNRARLAHLRGAQAGAPGAPGIDEHKGGGRPLDARTQKGFERILGQPLGDVRLHDGPADAAAARSLGTSAFTRGREITMDASRVRADSADGMELLAHEMVHVAQQGSARPVNHKERVAERHDAVEQQADAAVSRMAQMAGGQVPAGLIHVDRSAAPSAIYRTPPSAWTPDQKARFFEWWKRVAGMEGSYDAWVANKANQFDAGGETNWGVTWDTFHKNRPNATKEDFKAMTADQARGFGTGTYHAGHVDEMTHTGSSLQIADMFWGGNYDPKLINRALVTSGGKPVAKAALPEKETIEEINKVDQKKLTDALYDEREKQIDESIKKPTQKAFEPGWRKRNLGRWMQAKMTGGETERAARWLNGEDPSVIKDQLSMMTPAERKALHDAAVADPRVGKDANIAKMTEETK